MARPLLPVVLLGLAACAAGDGIGTSSSPVEGIAFTETTATAIPQQGCAQGAHPGCYTNFAITADLDGDGNLDLVMANGGGHFVPAAAEPQVVLFGDGRGGFRDGSTAFVAPKDSIVRQFAVADFDGDGRLDIYMPGAYGQHDDQLFLQTSPGRFKNEIERMPGRQSTAGAVHAGDIDNDGDIDLVVADWGPSPNQSPVHPASPAKVRILENDGSGHFTEKAVLDVPAQGAERGTTTTDIDLQDVNGDFALDIVLTARNGQSRLYLNDGKGTFEDVTRTKAFPKKQGPFTFNAELCDVDGDGDLDLLFDGGANSLGRHATQLLINDGTGKFTDETSERIVGEPSSDDNQVKCVDIDGDGDFDLVVASLSNPAEKLLRNVDGRGHFELVDNVFPRLGDPTLSLDFGDFDGDGKIDMFTAQGEVPSRPWIERIFKSSTTRADTNKPRFRAVETPKAKIGKPTILRVAVSDAHTSETGQHVKSVRVGVGGAWFPATFVGGDLFRAEIPPQPAPFTATPYAVDRAGNEAAGTPVNVVFE
jgi:hypothetical protein